MEQHRMQMLFAVIIRDKQDKDARMKNYYIRCYPNQPVSKVINEMMKFYPVEEDDIRLYLENVVRVGLFLGDFVVVKSDNKYT